jgi:uncharacterized protein YciI/uncharacterized protein YndB with AHSA1/START domain
MAAIAFLTPTRAGFHLDPTADELMALGAHFEMLQRLVREGRVSLAGPCEDGSAGVVVFPRDDAAAARAAMDADPCVRAGVMTCEVRPFRVSVFGTGTGRDWTGFTQAVHVRADRAALWRMIATCRGLEAWFLARAEARTADGRAWPADRALEAGARVRLVWPAVGEPGGERAHASGVAAPAEVAEEDTVLAVESAQRVRLGWYEDKGWVDIRLQPHPVDGRVTVELEQRMPQAAGFALLEDVYCGCKPGWAFFLTNLKCVAEGGPDLRERAPDRRDLVNA